MYTNVKYFDASLGFGDILHHIHRLLISKVQLNVAAITPEERDLSFSILCFFCQKMKFFKLLVSPQLIILWGRFRHKIVTISMRSLMSRHTGATENINHYWSLRFLWWEFQTQTRLWTNSSKYITDKILGPYQTTNPNTDHI